MERNVEHLAHGCDAVATRPVAASARETHPSHPQRSNRFEFAQSAGNIVSTSIFYVGVGVVMPILLVSRVLRRSVVS